MPLGYSQPIQSQPIIFAKNYAVPKYKKKKQPINLSILVHNKHRSNLRYITAWVKVKIAVLYAIVMHKKVETAKVKLEKILTERGPCDQNSTPLWHMWKRGQAFDYICVGPLWHFWCSSHNASVLNLVTSV